jgi:signal transduction histidine kinase
MKSATTTKSSAASRKPAAERGEPKRRSAAKIRTSAENSASIKKDASAQMSRAVTPNQQDKESVLGLVSMLVHDLESPLASMNYTLELMESGRFDDSNPLHKRMLEGAHLAVKRAETIVADMLTAAKSEEKDLSVNWRDVNLRSVAGKAVDMAVAAAGQNGITVALDPSSVDSNDSIVRADEHLVMRIVDNLIFNAIRHTPSNGKIIVSIQCDTKQVSIEITDSGEGITGIDPIILFEKFGQIEYRNQKKHRGVGLGLFFCRVAAEAMNAEMFARNAPDGGAQFGVTFPVSATKTAK